MTEKVFAPRECSEAELAVAECVGGILWLETYPGYKPQWVPVGATSLYLRMNILSAQSAEIYCYQSGEREHERRFRGV